MKRKFMENHWVVTIYTFLTENKPTVIVIILIGVASGLYSFFNRSSPKNSVSSLNQSGGITAGEINITNEQNSNGGAGGSIRIGGENKGTAIAGKGGSGGPGGSGGIGGAVEIDGDNTGFIMSGEGGEAGQLDRVAKGGRGPLEVIMENDPEKWKSLQKTFGLTEEMARTIGKGGDGASPTK
jgi:hypothetical protein